MALKKTTIVRSRTKGGARKIANARFPDWVVTAITQNTEPVREYRVTLRQKKVRKKK